MGAAPDDQCHAFTGRQRTEGCPQLIESRECGSCAMDGEAVFLKPALLPRSGFFCVLFYRKGTATKAMELAADGRV